MLTHDEETLARHRDMGAVCHRVIAHLAALTRVPDVRTILDAVDAALPHLQPNEARAHRQNIAGLARTYFTQFALPRDWSFHGTEVHLGHGRVDLLWRHDDGPLLIDEVKTGQPNLFATTANLAQARRYVTDAHRTFGAALIGLRLLCLTDPDRSLFLRPRR